MARRRFLCRACGAALAEVNGATGWVDLHAVAGARFDLRRGGSFVRCRCGQGRTLRWPDAVEIVEYRPGPPDDGPALAEAG